MIGILAAALLLQAAQQRMPVERTVGWTSHGPYGGDVYLLIDPKTPSTVYANGVNGIFRSTDGAATWAPTEFLGGAILAISPSDPQVIYTDQAKTVDAGVTWTPLAPPVPPDPSFHVYHSFVWLAVDPARSDTIYAGVDVMIPSLDFGPLQAQIYKSTDGGTTWRLSFTTGEPGIFNYWIQALAVDSQNPSGVHFVLATTAGQTVYNSSDGGSTWTPATIGIEWPVASFAAAPADVLYAGTFGGGAFRSADSGATWSPINNGLPPAALSFAYVAIAPSSPLVLYASTATGVFGSVDGGSSWTPADPTLVQGFLAVDPQDPSRLYYSGQDDEMLKSTDGGKSWTQADVGLMAIRLSGVAVDPFDSLTVFAAIDGGVAKSTDGGGHWSLRSAGLPPTPHIRSVVIDPQDSAVLYAPTDFSGVFRSDDEGSTWTAVNAGLPEPVFVSSVAIDPHDSSVLLAGTDQGVFKTQNGGQLWQAANIGLVGPGVSFVAVDGSLAFATTAEGLLRSLDSAASWTPTPLTQEVRSLTIDPRDPSRIFAATVTGLFLSADTGQSWNPTSLTTNTFSLALDPRGSEILYASSEGHILRSADGGQTWTPVARSLPGFWGSFVLDSTGTRLYAAASVGVFAFEFQETRVLPPRAESVVADSIPLARDVGSTRIQGDGSARSVVTVNGPIVLDGVPIASIAIDRFSPSTLYAGSFGDRLEVLKSVDQGGHWAPTEPVEAPVSYGVVSVATDPFFPETLFATFVGPLSNRIPFAYGGLYRSRDGGASWERIAGVVGALAPSPLLAGTIYALETRLISYPYLGEITIPVLTRNSGDTWTDVPYPLDSAMSIAIEPTSGELLLVGSLEGLLQTSNGGESWIDSSEGLSNRSVSAIEFSHDGQAAYAATPDGVFKSADDFRRWTPTGLRSAINGLAVDPSDSRILYASGYDASVFRTADAGDHWTLVSHPALSISRPALALDPTGTELFVGLETGIRRYGFRKTRILTR